MHAKLSRFALGGVALVVAFVLPACDKTQSPVGPSQNTNPVVVSVRVDPSSVNVGGTADVVAVVTDPDGDKVTCEWSSSGGGSFTALSSDRCRSRWQAGSTPGTFQLRVLARDPRGGSAAGAVDVVVGAGGPAGGPGPQPVPLPEPPSEPGPHPDPKPTPHPHPTPTPDPSPSPGPGNRPPNVQITAAQGSCEAPCQIEVSAQGSDPDSDRITLHFSGCASGDFSGATATTLCDVPTASTFTATVTARDTLGASSQASVTVSGVPSTNRPPTVTALAEKQSCHPLPGQPCQIVVSAQASDRTETR